MRRKIAPRRLVETALGLLVLLVVAFMRPEGAEPTDGAASQGTTRFHVTRVVDGDTVEVATDDGTRSKVRLIGVDAPESVDPRRPVECFGKEASAKLKELLEGKPVTLIADPTQDDKDRYGRLLRYVESEDGDAGRALLRQGYAHEYTYRRPHARKADYLAAMDAARAAQAGLWAPGACATEVAQ